MFALFFTATSSDYFEFPSDVKSTDEKVSLVQSDTFETTSFSLSRRPVVFQHGCSVPNKTRGVEDNQENDRREQGHPR